MNTQMLSIVIPAFNEEERIPGTLRDIDAYMSRQTVPYEIIVVDDGSRDGTVECVEKLRQSIENLRIVVSERNMGKGHAVRVGMLSAQGDIHIFMDADNAVPIRQFEEFTSHFASGAQVVIGSRYKKESRMKKRPPWYRVLWSRFANRVVQRAILPGIMDTQCGFKAFTREASQKLFGLARRNGWGFDLEILSLAKKYGLVVHEVPIAWTDDPRSRIHPVRDALKITWEFIGIKWDLMRNAYE